MRLGMTNPEAKPRRADKNQIVYCEEKGNATNSEVIRPFDRMKELLLTLELNLGLTVEVAKKTNRERKKLSSPTSKLLKPNTYLPSNGKVVLVMLFTDLAAMVMRERVTATYRKLRPLLSIDITVIYSD